MILYKYLHPDRVDVLENGQIRFTQPVALNDPFETLPIVDSLISANALERVRPQVAQLPDGFLKSHRDELIARIAEATDISEHVAASWIDSPAGKKDVEAFTRLLLPLLQGVFRLDLPGLRAGMPSSLQESVSENYGILSLTESADNLLMWSHYAHLHQGFVVGFREDHAFFDQRTKQTQPIRKLQRVAYSSQRPRFEGFDPGVHQSTLMEQVARDFLLTKSDHWEYEREWRMVMPLDEASVEKETSYGERISLFSFPADAVQELVYGCRCRKDTRNRLERTLRTHGYDHVNQSNAVIDENAFRLNIVRDSS